MSGYASNPNSPPIIPRFIRDVVLKPGTFAVVQKFRAFLPSKRQGPGRKQRLAN